MAEWNPNNVGQARKVNDIGSDLRIDQYLTNFSLAYRQERENFVAPMAATNIPVNNESDKYAIYPRGFFWRDEAAVRPLGGRPVQVGYKVTYGNYLAEEWALEHSIDDRQRRNAAQPFDVDESGVMLLEGKQMIRQDRIWAQTCFVQDVWAYDYEGTTDFPQFDDVASDPVDTIDDYKLIMQRGSGFKPNTIVLGAAVHKALRKNPSMVDRVKYTQTGIISMALLAALFEVENVMVASSVYTASAEGADVDDFQFSIDENSMWMGYIEPTPKLDAPTAIARFAWTGLIPGAMNSLGGVITRGRDDRAYSDWIHSRNAFDIKIVAADLGIFFKNAV